MLRAAGALLIAGLVLFPGVAGAERKKAAHALSDKDRAFMKEAAQGGMAEVRLGELAEKNAADGAVKRFATQMISDHGKATDELRSLAKAKDVTLPADVSDEVKAKLDELGKKTGADFDGAYMDTVRQEHQKEIDRFTAYADDNDADADLRSFARKALPVLRTHHMVARTTSASHGVH